jgi:hypothetical protein
MESKDILLLVLVITVFLFSIYRKYLKKKQSGQKEGKGMNSSGPGSIQASGEDDYEPYSKR